MAVVLNFPKKLDKRNQDFIAYSEAYLRALAMIRMKSNEPELMRIAKRLQENLEMDPKNPGCVRYKLPKIKL